MDKSNKTTTGLEKIINESIIEMEENEKESIESFNKDFKEFEKMKNEQVIKTDREQASNNEILTEALLNRQTILIIKSDLDKNDNFLKNGWKLIFTLVFLFSIVSYTIAVYHHEGTLKPLIVDVLKLIFKSGGS